MFVPNDSAETWIAVGVLAAMAIVLSLLNRRLRLFTRNTVLFMAVTLTAWTAISFLLYKHDIKIQEQWRARELRQRPAAGFLKNWLGQGRDVAVASLGLDSVMAGAVKDELGRIEARLEAEMVKAGREGARFGDLKVVAIDLDHSPSTPFLASYRGNGNESWGYTIILDDGSAFWNLKGTIESFAVAQDATLDGSHAFVLQGISGEVFKVTSPLDRSLRWMLDSRPNFFNGAAYSYDHRGWRLVRR